MRVSPLVLALLVLMAVGRSAAETPLVSASAGTRSTTAAQLQTSSVLLYPVFDGDKDAVKSIHSVKASLTQRRRDPDGRGESSTGFSVTAEARKDEPIVLRGQFHDTYDLRIWGRFTSSTMDYRQAGLEIDNRQGSQNLGEIPVLVGGSSLQGRIFEANGKPAIKAILVLAPNSSINARRGNSFDCASDEEGRYFVRGSSDETYTAIAWRHVYLPNGREAQALQTSHTLEIKGKTEHDFHLPGIFKLTARLAGNDATNGYRLSDIRDVDITRSANAYRGRDEDSLNIHYCDSGAISQGIVTFIGRFKGQYRFRIWALNQYAELPELLDIDNLDHDQDLGEVKLPALGQTGRR